MTDMGEYDQVIPMWQDDEKNLEKQGFVYYNDPDYKRLGFWKK